MVKYRIHICALLVSIIHTGSILPTQVIPHQVNPQIGQNLWQMNYNQSITIDDILDTTTLCCNCDFFITQADIDLNSGGFTIAQSGNWCLAEDIFTTAPIIISASSVSFDLKGRIITGTDTGASVILVVESTQDVSVKNGTIIGADLGGTSFSRTGLLVTDSTNILIENMSVSLLGSVDNNTLSQFNTGFESEGHTIFRNCFATGPFLIGFSVSGNGINFFNCEVNHFSGDLSNAGADLRPGVGYRIRGDSHYLENCISIGGEAQPNNNSAGSTGFYITSDKTTLYNCIALHHKNTFTTTPIIFPAGSGFYVVGDDCQISNCISAYNEQYGIFNSGTNLMVCNNELHNNGTSLSGTKESNLCNLLCSDYISQDRLPYTITEPGLYCVFGTLAETTGNAAITVTDGTSNVVINFAGYSLERTSVIHNEPVIIIGDGCEDITVRGGRIKSNGASDAQNIAVVVPAAECKLIEIVDLSFEGFNQAINIGDTNSNIVFSNCEALNNNNFIFCTGSRGISLSDCVASRGTSTTDSQITFSTGCANITLENTKVTRCGADAIYIQEANNINMSGLFICENEGIGIHCDTCINIAIENSTTFTNSLDGMFLNNSENIVLAGCSSLNNFAIGINIRGNTGGAIPAECPVTVKDCVAQSNLFTGFYFRNVGGLVVAGCYSSANLGHGFHLDGGTWNAQVKDSIALSNGLSGFMTWDDSLVAGSLYDNRFHACHAAQNFTTGAYVPGSTDFCMSNVFGVVMLPPIAGPVPSALATIPPPVVSVTPPDFCTFF